VGIDPVIFWRLCPRALRRVADASVQRFRLEHGLGASNVLTDPEEMERALMELARADGAVDG